jgi:hypothetical protein
VEVNGLKRLLLCAADYAPLYRDNPFNHSIQTTFFLAACLFKVKAMGMLEVALTEKSEHPTLIKLSMSEKYTLVLGLPRGTCMEGIRISWLVAYVRLSCLLYYHSCVR